MSWTYTSAPYDGRYLQLNITESVDASSNSSTLYWELISDGGSVNFYRIDETVVTINGEVVYYKDVTSPSDEFPSSKGSVSGSIKVVHDANGSKTGVTVSFKTRVYNWGSQEYADDVITLTSIPTYTLSISAGTGSNISVSRTSSGYASTGSLSNGARLYYNDKLKISFVPSANYAIDVHTVNESTFTSGNTHTVTGNVSVRATAQVLASAVGASDAFIDSVSTITVTKYNSAYYHSLQYSFGTLSGYITSSGEIQTTEVKLSNTSVPFYVPETFYAQIPNSSTGKCTITCRTYSSSSSATVLGAPTQCTFTVTAGSVPIASGSVADVNSTTIALTGDPMKLIRYKSTAKATITAKASHSATIVSKYINEHKISENSYFFYNCSESSFVFKVTDSRGRSNKETKTPTIVPYIRLTVNPLIFRVSPTGSTVSMTLSGDYYNGSFGAAHNTLTVAFRYKERGGSYSVWETIDSTKIVTGTRGYTSDGEIELGNNFDYSKEYVFEVKATDGTSNRILSTITKQISVPRGIPVFDWSGSDFNFNVPIMVEDTPLFDIIYPINSIYWAVSATLPTALAKVGEWKRIPTSATPELKDIYAWKRVK